MANKSINNKDEPSTAPESDRWYDLTLGSSFKDPHSSTKFCTLRCKSSYFSIFVSVFRLSFVSVWKPRKLSGKRERKMKLLIFCFYVVWILKKDAIMHHNIWDLGLVWFSERGGWIHILSHFRAFFFALFDCPENWEIKRFLELLHVLMILAL